MSKEMQAAATANPQPCADLLAGFVQSEQAYRAQHRIADDKIQPFHLAVILAKQRPNNPNHLVAQDAARLIQLGRALAGLAVAHCNTGLTDRQEAREMTLSAEVRIIAGWYGLKAETSGDPRGYVVRLHGPDVPKNGWGDGFGVA